MIRLLRIEARHNPAPLVLPLLAILLGITPLAQDLTPVALWLDRSADVEGSIQLIGPFAAGAAAWTASREHRSSIGDLLASTPRNPWLRTASAWLVSLAWMAGFYLAVCTAFLSITATQATWGRPDLWPAVAGFFALVMCSAVGFALGLRFTTRFITPLVAVGTLAVILGVRSATVSDQMAGIGLLSPIYPGFGLNASVFYAPQPDLSMLKIVCDLGVLALALGVAAWCFRADRPSLRRGGAALLAAGFALTAAAGGLDATARSDGHGIIVPAFHDAAADHAVAYTPVCSRTLLPVCVHPAYDGGHEPAVLSAMISKIVSPVVGVPGMPVRAEQAPAGLTSAGGVQGNPPVLTFQPFIMHGSSLQPTEFAMFFEDSVALSLFLPPHALVKRATPAQRALALYLLQQAGDTASPAVIPPAPAVTAGAARFAALRPAARTAWLTTHLAALRAGSLTPEDIP
jgi:hypothetical protein